MGIDINKAKVVFFPAKDGTKQFEDFYTGLAITSLEDTENNVKYQFIKTVLKRLRTIDKENLPKDTSALEFNFEIDIAGVSYNRPLKIVKKLGKGLVYELRIDLQEFNWYFRATFFPMYNESTLYYCVVYPFTKVPGYEDPTDSFRDLTHEVYNACLAKPDEYFKK